MQNKFYFFRCIKNTLQLESFCTEPAVRRITYKSSASNILRSLAKTGSYKLCDIKFTRIGTRFERHTPMMVLCCTRV